MLLNLLLSYLYFGLINRNRQVRFLLLKTVTNEKLGCYQFEIFLSHTNFFENNAIKNKQLH